MLDEIITIYAIVEDLLKATGHLEDCRIQMSDPEVITTGLVAAKFFKGNQSNACQYLLEHNCSSERKSTQTLSICSRAIR
ncbi:transposase (plasmid) [Chondrocystis sp. NIES-4102]|nr:transposase [Chondrocystis sp. NIES-4102]